MPYRLAIAVGLRRPQLSRQQQPYRRGILSAGGNLPMLCVVPADL